MRRFILSLTVLAIAFASQTRAQQGNQALPKASSGSGVTFVASNPATCTTGTSFYNTTTGQTLYCISTNTLTVGSTGSTGPLNPNISRSPSQLDDAAHGVQSSAYWINTLTGDTFQNLATTNGAASWVRLIPSYGLPADIASTNLLAAYGVRKLSSTYTGNCCTIKRESDSTTQVLGFVNGYVDVATAGLFCQATVCHISTWNDQSGNARDCTQATLGTSPYFAINTLGNGVTVTFWNSVTADAPVTNPTYCALPSGVAATAPNYSFVIVGQGRNGAGAEFVSLGPTMSNILDFQYIQSSNITVLSSPIPFYGGTASTLPMEQTPAVFIASSNSTNVNYWINETTVTGAKSAVAQAFTGGNLGFESMGSTPYYGDMSAALIYSANINSVRQSLSNSLYRLFGIAPQVSNNTWLVDGDSIENGTGGQGLNNYSSLAQKQLPTRLVLTSTTGITCATLNSRYATNIAPMFPTYGRNKVLVLRCGTNDLTAGTAAATIWSNIQGYIGKAVATGWTVVIGTVLPCSGVGSCTNTNYAALNTLIRAGAVQAGASVVCDYASDPNIGQASDNSNATYFLTPDAIHPNDLGNAVLAQYELACVQPLLNR